MNSLLQLYLAAERLMLLAEVVDERIADGIRDQLMDSIWHRLSPDERRALDEREVHFFRNVEGLHVPLTDELYIRSSPPEKREIPSEPITGWRMAA